MADRPLVLAIDDEPDFLEIVSALLESSGFRASTLTTSGNHEIIKFCEELRPDIVLLDIYFFDEPRGLQLAEEIKKNPRTSQVKVILWSSAPEPSDSPADDFFNKGEDLSVLLEKIRGHLNIS